MHTYICTMYHGNTKINISQCGCSVVPLLSRIQTTEMNFFYLGIYIKFPFTNNSNLVTIHISTVPYSLARFQPGSADPWRRLIHTHVCPYVCTSEPGTKFNNLSHNTLNCSGTAILNFSNGFIRIELTSHAFNSDLLGRTHIVRIKENIDRNVNEKENIGLANPDRGKLSTLFASSGFLSNSLFMFPLSQCFSLH